MKSFASDNWASISNEVIEKIKEINNNHSPAYSDDEYIKNVEKKIQDFFEYPVKAFFLTTGTSTNVVGLKSILNTYNSVIATEEGHINTDECGSFELITGSKILTVPSHNGKLKIEDCKKYLLQKGSKHRTQVKAIYISQATERETLYTPQEIKEIADFAHKNNMYLFLDGARFCNACVALNKNPKELSVDLGVDIMSFGLTKNGAMIAESVIVINKELQNNICDNFIYIQKQCMQQVSKARYIACQFDALLTNDLWKKNAEHANNMAKLLEIKLKEIPEIKITMPVEVNAIYCIIPSKVSKIIDKMPFYIFIPETNEARLMTSFDTTLDDIEYFINELKKELK